MPPPPGRRHLAHPEPDPPGPGLESASDYPRPPRLEATDAVLEVELGGVVVARSEGGRVTGAVVGRSKGEPGTTAW